MKKYFIRKPARELIAIRWDGDNISEFQAVPNWNPGGEPSDYTFVENNGQLEVSDPWTSYTLNIGDWFVTFYGKQPGANPDTDIYQELLFGDGTTKYVLEAE